MDINELLETVTEQGGPFSDWVTVTLNTHGGIDITNTRTGETFRIAVDDETVYLHVFKNGWNGRLGTLSGTLAFSGFLACPAFVAPALVNLL